MVGERGVTVLETLVALALIAMTVVAFLSGLATISSSSGVADVKGTAGSLALSQMEWVKQTAYVPEATGYPAAPILDITDYTGYSAIIEAAALHNPDAGLQKITVTVNRFNESVLIIEGYKADR